MRHAYLVAAEVMRRICAFNSSFRLLNSAATISAVLLFSACSRKSSAFRAEAEPDITGSPSDPAIELKCELKPNLRFSFHLETENSYKSNKWKFGSDAQETHFETD